MLLLSAGRQQSVYLSVCMFVCMSVSVCVCMSACVLCESGDVQVTMTTDQGVNVPVKLIDNHDRTYRVEFEPTIVGTYNTNVMFAGQLTPASPYKINVQPAAVVDPSKVRVTDMPQGAQRRSFFRPYKQSINQSIS